MRGAWPMWLVLAACTTSDPPPSTVVRRDTGTFPADSGLRPLDSTVDAFRWPDTGPQPPPVLPRQSWTMRVAVSADVFDVTINLDERAESGLVRAVAGGGGRGANVIFDVLPEGILRSRGPIVLGLPGIHTCTPDTVAIEEVVLRFGDTDGDGISETLISVSSNGLVTRSGPAFPLGSTSGEPVSVTNIHPDATEPNVTLLQPGFIPGLEPIVLVSSEPIEPSFMPRLVGPRTVLLHPDVGASAPSRWTAPTEGLPAGHYTLDFGAFRDVSGLAPADPPPAVALDVTAPTAPAFDDVDPRVATIFASGGMSLFGEGTGEVPLVGATSLLVRGRAVVVLDLTRGVGVQLQIIVRVAGPASVPYVNSFLTVYDDDGVVLTQAQFSSFFATSGTPGFDVDDGVGQPVFVAFTSMHTSRVYAQLDLGGVPDPACSGAAPAGLGAVIDGISLIP